MARAVNWGPPLGRGVARSYKQGCLGERLSVMIDIERAMKFVDPLLGETNLSPST